MNLSSALDNFLLCGEPGMEMEYVGQGLDRTVFRSGDFVYKFESECQHDPKECQNLLEYRNYEILIKMDLPDPWILAPMELVHVGSHPVIKMPYVDGVMDYNDPQDISIALEVFAIATGLCDVVPPNVAWDGNNLIPVDLGI